jgi:hypothetical protein
MLLRKAVIKRSEDKNLRKSQYALYDYDDLYAELEDVIQRYANEYPKGRLSIQELANYLRVVPNRIEEQALLYLRKYRVQLQEKEQSKPPLKWIDIPDKTAEWF